MQAASCGYKPPTHCTRQDDIDKTLLEQHLRKTGLPHAAKAFGYIAVRHQGLPEHALPFSTKEMAHAGKALPDNFFAIGNPVLP